VDAAHGRDDDHYSTHGLTIRINWCPLYNDFMSSISLDHFLNASS
jgi:hypothetical protein